MSHWETCYQLDDEDPPEGEGWEPYAAQCDVDHDRWGRRVEDTIVFWRRRIEPGADLRGGSEE